MRKTDQKKSRPFRPNEALFDKFVGVVGLGPYSATLEALVLHYIELDEPERTKIQNRLVEWRKENGIVVYKGRPPAENKTSPAKTGEAKHMSNTHVDIPLKPGHTKKR